MKKSILCILAIAFAIIADAAPVTSSQAKQAALVWAQNEGTAQAITQSQYLEILQQRGLKNLENYKIQNNLNCTIDPNYYTFNVDYQVGDMVTMITPFLSQNVIIKEVTENWGENGYNVSITLDQNIEE